MLYKRGRYWWVRIRRKSVGEINRSSKSEKKAVAAKLERQILAEIDQLEEDALLGKKPKHGFDEALTRWLNSGAQDSWLPKIDQILPYFAGTKLVDAPKVASLMREELRMKGLKPGTINRRLAVVRRVLNLAYDEYDMLDQPLAKKIRLESEKGTERQVYLTKQEFNSLFAMIQPTAPKADYQTAKAAILLMAMTGLRKSEVLRLQPADWRPPMLVVRKSKSGKPRSVPVHPSVHSICEQLPLVVSENQLRYWWEKARKKAGLTHVRMHDLRHTFASWYADDPMSTIVQLSHLLGHSNLAVTSKYTHLIDGKELPPALGDGINTVVH